MKNELVHKLHEKFIQIVILAGEVNKTPRPYGTDSLMTSSEINLVELIGDNEAIYSVTDLAKITEVTKGAVSQTLKKLENKGLIIKEIDPSNLSRITVALTSRGKTAYYSHKDWHETMDGGFIDFFNNLSAEKLDFLIEVLNKLEKLYQKVME